MMGCLSVSSALLPLRSWIYSRACMSLMNSSVFSHWMCIICYSIQDFACWG